MSWFTSNSKTVGTFEKKTNYPQEPLGIEVVVIRDQIKK
jgi:hypothetical protein